MTKPRLARVVIRNESGEVLIDKRLDPGEKLTVTVPDDVTINRYRETTA